MLQAHRAQRGVTQDEPQAPLDGASGRHVEARRAEEGEGLGHGRGVTVEEQAEEGRGAVGE